VAVFSVQASASQWVDVELNQIKPSQLCGGLIFLDTPTLDQSCIRGTELDFCKFFGVI
jgi:hypothetical protein